VTCNTSPCSALHLTHPLSQSRDFIDAGAGGGGTSARGIKPALAGSHPTTRVFLFNHKLILLTTPCLSTAPPSHTPLQLPKVPPRAKSQSRVLEASGFNETNGLRLLAAASNGDIYEGEYINGRIDGQGKATRANGDFYEGVFRGGKLLKWQDDDFIHWQE